MMISGSIRKLSTFLRKKHVFVGSPRYYRSSIIAFVFLLGFYQRKSVSASPVSDSSKQIYQTQICAPKPQKEGVTFTFHQQYLFLSKIILSLHEEVQQSSLLFHTPATLRVAFVLLASYFHLKILSLSHIILTDIPNKCHFEGCVTDSSLSHSLLIIKYFPFLTLFSLLFHTHATLRVAFLLLAFPIHYISHYKIYSHLFHTPLPL